MRSQFLIPSLALLSQIPQSLASLALSASYPGVAYTPATSWIATCPGAPQPCFDGCAAYFGNGDVLLEFDLPSPSTTFKWFAYPRTGAGLARVCVDGANCQNVSYLTPGLDPNSDPPTLILSLTGLTNTNHRITFENIADTNNGGNFGQINFDHFVIDGTPVTVPTFPSDTTVNNIPAAGDLAHAYHVFLGFGDTPSMEVLLDAGADAGYVKSPFCTDPNTCGGNAQYLPGPSFVNDTHIDETCFGDGSDCVTAWRVNDTVTWGNIPIAAEFGALFLTTGPQVPDGSLGIAKTYWYGGACVRFPNLVEFAFIENKIKNPTLAWYLITPTDNAASGVTSVAQLGGVDKNKYTGSIDWIPLTLVSSWQSSGSTKTVIRTAGGPIIPTQFTIPITTFDTGNGGGLSIPTNDWNVLLGATGAFQDGSQNWFFPCGSVLTINFGGSQNRGYPIPLADPTQPNANTPTFCAAVVFDSGSSTNWVLGIPFLSQYYLIFHYQDNLMGFATKNLAASAATTSVLTGSG